MTRLYWIGPYGLLIPVNIRWATASDGGNKCSRDGCQTEMWCGPEMTREAYLSKYGRQSEDGNYYFETSKDDAFVFDNNDDTIYYWVGPYGMLIPSTIDAVSAEDGSNTTYSDGSTTEMGVRLTVPMTRERYLSERATLSDDGHWYYAKTT